LKVEVIHSETNFDFKIKSTAIITVSDFVEIVNAQVSKLIDVRKNDIVITNVILKSGKIVILTQTYEEELN
jgi:hypothetical protein